MAFYTEFSEHYETIFPFRKPVLEFLDKWLPQNGKILDVGCGSGSYVDGLNQTGRNCLGTDLDTDMIKVAQERFPGQDFKVLGMEDLKVLPAASFHGIYCIGNVLPHLPSGGLSSFLATVKNLLKPQGVWIFQTVNFDPLLDHSEHSFPVKTYPDQGLEFHRHYRQITPESLVFETRLLKNDEEVFQGKVSLCPRSADHLLKSHERAGFAPQGQFADFSGKAFQSQVESGNVSVYRLK